MAQHSRPLTATPADSRCWSCLLVASLHRHLRKIYQGACSARSAVHTEPGSQVYKPLNLSLSLNCYPHSVFLNWNLLVVLSTLASKHTDASIETLKFHSHKISWLSHWKKEKEKTFLSKHILGRFLLQYYFVFNKYRSHFRNSLFSSCAVTSYLLNTMCYIFSGTILPEQQLPHLISAMKLMSQVKLHLC